MDIALITTTIHVPSLLDDYCRDAHEYGHDTVSIYVIGDKKTPAECATLCADLQKKYGYPVRYMSVDDQLAYLAPYADLRDHLPYNSIQRRNIGLLAAYKDGADVIITIDDDNFLAEPDFIGKHAVVGTEREVTLIASITGWYNVCELLEERRNLPFYHRGYPLGQRWKGANTTSSRASLRVVVNAGLWLEAPDIDALTWLDLPIESTRYIADTYPEGIALAPGTWSPFNSQNTALARDVIPAYFLSPHIGRYDDIWASYIVKRIADHRGDIIHFGHPLVRQKRNPHNYFKDFDNERMGMELTDAFVATLRDIPLAGQRYGECFGEIIEALTDRADSIVADADPAYGAAFEQMLAGMRIWREATAAVPVQV